MDLTRYDKTIYEPVSLALIHPYSDADKVVCNIRCMKLEEIIATKLKCLMQRQKAPDLFDYAYSIQLLGGKLNKDEVREALVQKTIFNQNPYILKGIIEATDFDFFRKMWLKSIICAKKQFIKVENAISTLLTDLDNLFASVSDNGYARFAYFPVEARTKIMKAARSQTLLEIMYNNDIRLVEPYALKFMKPRNKQPREYLYVFNQSGGSSQPGWRTFGCENMQSIENTDKTFKPQYPIELSKAGELPENPYLFDPNKPTKRPSRRKSFANIFSRINSNSPTYVYQCSYCGKKFYRKNRNSANRKHKDNNGYSYNGKTSYYIDTKY